MPGTLASADLQPANPLPGLSARHPAGARRLLLVAVLALPGLAAAATSCQARSGAARVSVIELYTSEGCSSCPPADRWFSSLKSSSDEASSGNAAANPLLPLAFHVTYWDRLGWADRFAHPAYTERQNQLAAAAGARVVYTPQVIVDGADWRGWPRLPKPASAPEVELQLRRDGETFSVEVKRRDGVTPTARQLSGYWALLEDGHRTEVRAGENAGASLRHDHVVRAYQPVSSWDAEREQQWSWQPPKPEQGTKASFTQRRVAFVVVDARTLKPLQALALSC